MGPGERVCFEIETRPNSSVEATLALRLECTVEELLRTIHAHPTMSEAVLEAAHAAHGAPLHA